MSFHDELLEESIAALRRAPTDETQGRLRRAVSTAYYALFHLLISEAVMNWNRPEQRERLARAFEHKHMRKASDQLKGRSYAAEDPTVVVQLKQIAVCFVELQQGRIEADYDRMNTWTHRRAEIKIEQVHRAFNNVKTIRTEAIFQDYLLSLFVTERTDDQP